MADNSSLFRLLWPEIADAESAKAAARLGAFGAALYSLANASIATYGLYRIHAAVSWASASAYLGAVMFGVLAFGIFKLWRSAAIAALVLFLGVQVLAGIRVHATGVLAVVLVLFMISGARGTVLFHKFSRLEAAGSAA